ncbi:hypothetical protein EPKpNR5180_43710 [Klebsiella pneumoniae]
MHHCSVGVELCRRVAGIVSELFNQVFVGFTEIILGNRFNAKRNFTEMLDKISQQMIGQALFIGPLCITEDAM